MCLILSWTITELWRGSQVFGCVCIGSIHCLLLLFADNNKNQGFQWMKNKLRYVWTSALRCDAYGTFPLVFLCKAQCEWFRFNHSRMQIHWLENLLTHNSLYGDGEMDGKQSDMWQRSRGGFELVMLWWNRVRAHWRPLPAESLRTASPPSLWHHVQLYLISISSKSESPCRFRGSVSCDPAGWHTDTFVACDTKSTDTVDAGWTETDLCCRTSLCDSRRKHKHREYSQTDDCSCGAATITVVIACARYTDIMYVRQHIS